MTESGSPAPAPPDRGPAVRRLVMGAVLAVLVYAAIVAFSDARQTAAALAGIVPWTVPLALGLVAVGYACRLVRWHLFLGWVDHPAPPFAGGLAFFSGFALTLTPGKLGEVVKAYYLWERARTPYHVSMGVVVAERALDVVALTALLGVGALIVPGLPAPAVVTLLVLVTAGLLLLRSHAVVALLLNGVERVWRARRAVPWVRNAHANSARLLTGGPLAAGTLLGLAGWFLEPVAMWVLARGLGLDLALVECLFVYVAATVAGVATMIPAGLGVTEGGMVALLANLGVPLASASALTLAVRLATLWWGIAIGSAALVVLRATRRSLATSPRREVGEGPAAP